MLGVPTYVGKNYCLSHFCEGLDALNKDGFQVRVLFVDNTNDGGENAQKIEDFSGYTCHHLDVSNYHTTNEKLAESHNYLRRAALSLKADYLFHVESDLLLHPMTLQELYVMDKPLATSLYAVGVGAYRYPLFSIIEDATPRFLTPCWVDTTPQMVFRYHLKRHRGRAMSVGVGVMLMHKEVLKKVPFVGDSSAKFTPDSQWTADCARHGFFPEYNLRVFAHHMNDLGWGLEHQFRENKVTQQSYKEINYDS